jgi:hypothetical protein
VGRARIINTDLPPRMLKRVRGKITYYYYASKGVNRKEVALGSNKASAILEYKRLSAGDSFSKSGMPPRHPAVLLNSIKRNAKVRSIPVALTAADIESLLARANGRCELTSIAFDYSTFPGQRVRPWAASIDRIESQKGYEIENCRVVCAAVNIALNQFGEDVLVAIAAGLLRGRAARGKNKNGTLSLTQMTE